MKKIFILLLLVTLLPAYNIKQFQNKIFYVEFSSATMTEGKDFILFNTHLPAHDAFLLNNGIIILHRGKNISKYAASGMLLKQVNLNFNPDIVIPSSDGDFAIIGRAQRKEKKYILYKLNFKKGKTLEFITLDSDHFPGVYSPIDAVKQLIKEDPSFKDDYFNQVYQFSNFNGGKIDGNTLYIWYWPNHSLYFGAIYSISLKNGKLKVINDRIEDVCGINRGKIVYTVLKDKNAGELDRAIYLHYRNKDTRITFPFINGKVFFGGSNIATISNDTLYVASIKSNKVIGHVSLIRKNPKILAFSPSGNRVFLLYDKTDKIALSVFDARENKLKEIKTFAMPKPGGLSCSFDGEAFTFTRHDSLCIGYISDLYAPYASFFLPDTTNEKSVNLKIRAFDDAFVSGFKSLSVNGQNILPDSALNIPLKTGDNPIRITVSDRAGNTRRYRRIIYYIKDGE